LTKKDPVDYIIIGDRSGLGAGLVKRLGSLHKTCYHNPTQQNGSAHELIDTLLLDEICSEKTVIVLCDVSLNLSKYSRKQAALYNMSTSETVADLIYDRSFQHLYFVSHVLSPTLEEIQEAATAGDQPIAMVSGLQRAEQNIHRAGLEGASYTIIKIPFISARSTPSADGLHGAISVEQLADSITNIISVSAPDTYYTVEPEYLCLTENIEELQDTSSTPSLWSRLTGIFRSDDELPIKNTL